MIDPRLPDPEVSDLDAAELVLFLDGQLPAERAAAIETRLARDPALAAALDRRRAVAQIISTAVSDALTPHDLRLRIDALSTGASAQTRPRRRWLGVLAPATTGATRRGRWLSGAAATAVVVAAVLVGTLVSGGDGLPAPDATFALVNTDLAPAARGTASVRATRSGDEIVLDVRGLPRAPAGAYYQAWVKSPTRGLVPIGTFHTGASRVTLWSGVDAREYSLLTVTIELEDDDPASSGRRVLSAELR